MEKIATSEAIDPCCLGKKGKRHFIHELYEVQCQIFQDFDINKFYNRILRPDAVRTRVKIFRNYQQELVGFYAIHLFEIRIRDAESTAIFRAEAGLLRAYRRKQSTLNWNCGEMTGT